MKTTEMLRVHHHTAGVKGQYSPVCYCTLVVNFSYSRATWDVRVFLSFGRILPAKADEINKAESELKNDSHFLLQVFIN